MNYLSNFQYKNWRKYIYIYIRSKSEGQKDYSKLSTIVLSLENRCRRRITSTILSSSLSRIDSRASIGPSGLVRRVPFGCSRLFWHLHSVCRGYRRDVTRTWITSGIATRADGKRRIWGISRDSPLREIPPWILLKPCGVYCGMKRFLERLYSFRLDPRPRDWMDEEKRFRLGQKS